MAEQLSLLLSQGWLTAEDIRSTPQLPSKLTGITQRQVIFLRLPKNASSSVIELFQGLNNVDLVVGGHNECLELCSVDSKKLDSYRSMCSGSSNTIDTSKLSSIAAATESCLGTETYKTAYKFAIVRNPYDRAVSSWLYTRRPEQSFEDWAEVLASRGLASEEWTWHERTHICAQLPHLRDCSSSRAHDRDTKLAVDFVGRFEALDDAIAHVYRELGVDPTTSGNAREPSGAESSLSSAVTGTSSGHSSPCENPKSSTAQDPVGAVQVPHINGQARDSNYRNYYQSTRTREAIYSVYQEDIDFFGYEF